MSAKAIRTLNFLVTPEGITPATPMAAGVQGDHNATEVVFTLDATLAFLEDAVYRFEYEDGAGALDVTAPLTPNSYGELRTLLPLHWTSGGGIAQLRVVIARAGENGDEQVLYSVAARLRYAPRLEAGEQLEAMSPLFNTALQKADEAMVQVQQLSEESKRYLRKDRLGYGLAVFGMDDYLCLAGDAEVRIREAMSTRGGTFTGQVKGITPIEAEDLVTKAYVDAAIQPFGDIEAALDSILAQQEALIGGGAA